jgi:hypothetical protein
LTPASGATALGSVTVTITNHLSLFGQVNSHEPHLNARTTQFNQGSAKPSTSQFVAESLLEEHRNSSECTKDEFGGTGGDMQIAARVLLPMLIGLTGLTGSIRADRSECVALEPAQQSNSGQRGQINGNQIKITIATGGGPYRPARDSFRVGEPIPLVITMTNTGSQPVYVCESGTLYQDRPQLLKDGQPFSYTSFRQSMIQTAEKDNTCDKENLPQQVLLRPNEPTVVDWFNLAEGATSLYDDGWYESLRPGKYTLTNKRRLSCCDGAFVEANTINFVVVQ